MRNIIKKYWVSWILAIIQFIVVAYFLSPLLDIIVSKFSTIKYVDDYSFQAAAINYLTIFIFCIVGAVWNVKTLEHINRKGFLQLAIMAMIDLLILCLSILIMVMWNNGRKGLVGLNSVINIYLTWLLIAIKHIIIFIMYKKIYLGVHKRK